MFLHIEDPQVVRCYEGLNPWTTGKTLLAKLDLPNWQEGQRRWDEIDDLLAQWGNERVSFGQNDRTPLAFVEAIATLAATLQTLVYLPTARAVCHAVHNTSQFHVALPCEEFRLAEAALVATVSTVRQAARGTVAVRGEVVERLFAELEDLLLGPSSLCILRAARKRQIPVYRLTEDSLLQLGEGRFKRRIQTAVSDSTGSIAEGIAKNKDVTKRILSAAGVPVPIGREVTSAADAWQVASEIGLPVVVKPRDGNHSTAVSLNLSERSKIEAAFREAERQGKVLVERYISGSEHRFLVIGGRLVAAARREPAHVLGDGERTIAQLMQRANELQRRGPPPTRYLPCLPQDAVALELLREQGLSLSSIPDTDRKVLLRRHTNIARGGTAIDVTRQVHPRVAAVVERSAKLVGLDIAGIDLVASTISRPLEESGGAIVEVNAGPGLSIHLDPWPSDIPVGEAVVDFLIPQADQRLTVFKVIVSGPSAKSASKQSAAEFARRDWSVAVFDSDQGITLGNETIRLRGTCAAQIRQLMQWPDLDGILIVLSAEIIDSGIGFDSCDLWIEMNVALNGDSRTFQNDERLRANAMRSGAKYIACKSVAEAADAIVTISSHSS